MFVWWLDRYEKEPPWLIAAAFLWGSLPAIGLALLFELGLQIPLARSPIGPDLAAWGLAPLVEEPVKALALVGLFLLARREFDGPLDGIVYGSLVGFGFSMTENLLYFLRYSDRAGRAVLGARGLFRAEPRAVLQHGRPGARRGALSPLAVGRRCWRFVGGLALAILFHALHNYAVRYQFAGLFFSWLIQSSGVIVVLAIAVLAWRNERRWIEQELGDEVRAGVLSAADYAEVASPARRVRRQLRTLLTGGWSRYRQTRRMHQLATELAFCKSQLRLEDRYRTCAERDQLRGELTALRALIERDEQIWGEL